MSSKRFSGNFCSVYVHFSSATLSLFLPLGPLLSLLFLPLSLLRQTGSVSVGQVILGVIGRLMFIQETGTLTCLSSSIVHFLPNSKSQTPWRLTETYANVLFSDFSSACHMQGWHWRVHKWSDLVKVSSCTTNLGPYLLHYENAERKKASLDRFKE